MVHGPNIKNQRKNMQKMQHFSKVKSVAFLLPVAHVLRTSAAVAIVSVRIGDV